MTEQYQKFEIDKTSMWQYIDANYEEYQRFKKEAEEETDWPEYELTNRDKKIEK